MDMPSWTALMLSRTNIGHLSIFDPDIVDQSNMSGQFFRTNQVGLSKINAICVNIREYSEYHCFMSYTSRFGTANYISDDITICAVDNMITRKMVFTKWKEMLVRNSELHGVNFNPSKYLFIDGRLEAEEFQIFCITGDNYYGATKYRDEFLFNDSDVPDAACTYKQTTYTAAMIGSFIANLVVNFATNITNPTFNRDLPFLTTYKADIMMLTTEN